MDACGVAAGASDVGDGGVGTGGAGGVAVSFVTVGGGAEGCVGVAAPVVVAGGATLGNGVSGTVAVTADESVALRGFVDERIFVNGGVRVADGAGVRLRVIIVGVWPRLAGRDRDALVVGDRVGGRDELAESVRERAADAVGAPDNVSVTVSKSMYPTAW